MEAYSAFAKKFAANYGDKKCDPLPIWPEVVLRYCDSMAERLGYGDEELTFCSCYDVETKQLTRRKQKTKGEANEPKNYVKIDFKSGVPPVEDIEDEPQRAIMDLAAKTSSSSAWSNGWRNPRLDSKTGFHNAPGKGEETQWW